MASGLYTQISVMTYESGVSCGQKEIKICAALRGSIKKEVVAYQGGNTRRHRKSLFIGCVAVLLMDVNA